MLKEKKKTLWEWKQIVILTAWLLISKSVLTGTAVANSNREMEIYYFALVHLSV